MSLFIAFWFTVSFFENEEIKIRLLNELQDFHVIKDELSIPLRNTDSIVRNAYKLEGNSRTKTFLLINFLKRPLESFQEMVKLSSLVKLSS